jgi:cytochrome P450
MSLSAIKPVAVSGVSAVLWYLRFARDQLGAITIGHEKYGPFIELPHPRFFGHPRDSFLVAVGATFNREVLDHPAVWGGANFVPDGPKNSAARRLSRSLYRLSGREHQHYRRLLTRPLGRTSVEAMGADMLRMAEAEVNAWPAGEIIDLWAYVQKLVQTLVIGLLFGDDRQNAESVIDLVDCRANWSIGSAFCPTNVPGTSYYRMLRQSEALESRIIDWIRWKRRHPSNGDLLSILANSPDEDGKPATESSIVGHIPFLFGAGYLTNQSALIWTLILVSQHPQIASDLLDELKIGGGGSAPTFEQLGRLPLLNAVVKESMRILPPVPHQARVARCETMLAGYRIPQRTRVILSSLLTNRDAAIYSEPDRFKPTRWETIDPSPYEYLVFSAGPRNCLGYWFALSIIKVTLAAVFTRYRISLLPNARIDYKARITLSPRRGVQAVLHRQDGAFTAAPFCGNIRNLLRFPA